MAQEQLLKQLPQDLQLEEQALALWLAHPVTQTYLACLDLYHEDIEDDLDGELRQLLATPNEDFIKSLTHKAGQRFAMEHIKDLSTFIARFGGLLAPEDDPTATQDETLDEEPEEY